MSGMLKKVRQRRSLPSPKRFAQAGRIVQTLNVPLEYASAWLIKLFEYLAGIGRD